MSTLIAPSRATRRFISPRARRALGLHQMDAAQINGSGPNGRIVEADVLRSLENLNAPKSESSRALFSLRTEVDASALLKLETRSKISRKEWIERALSQAVSSLSPIEASLHCVFQESKSKRADEFRPALPADAVGVLGAGRIAQRAFTIDGEVQACPTLHLHFCGEEIHRETLEQVFDLVIEILEDPMMLIFL